MSSNGEAAAVGNPLHRQSILPDQTPESAAGWFAARPSGTEDIYKIYAESFRGADHLHRIQEEAQAIVSDTLAASDPKEKS